MITESMRWLLRNIFEETEALDKITVTVDRVSRSVTICYEDIDDNDFNEVCKELEA